MFWWKELARDTAEYVHSCSSCGAGKIPRIAPAGPQAEVDPPGEPMEEVGIDFIGLFPAVFGQRYVCMTVDLCSRFLRQTRTARAYAQSG